MSLLQWCRGMDVAAVLSVLDSVVQQQEVNWEVVLPLLSVFLTVQPQAADQLKSEPRLTLHWPGFNLIQNDEKIERSNIKI